MNWHDISFLKFNALDFLDILVVAILIYLIFNLLRGTIAVNIFIGICIITLFYWIVKALRMELLTGILDKFLSVSYYSVRTLQITEPGSGREFLAILLPMLR
jgi:DNA integrity scanning protein DisA with diadenylate cyclase activity